MSDLCVHQIGDIVWDDFCFSDVHMGFPGSQQLYDRPIPGRSLKKRQHHKTIADNSCSHGDDAAENGTMDLGKRRNLMSEQDFPSHSPSDLHPSLADGIAFTTLASGNSASSVRAFENDSGNGFCGNETILDETANAVDNESFGYPLDDVTGPVDTLYFFENSECKDSSDFLSYGWPEIGNFEDVYRIFRSCDSTFGVGSSKEVDPCLFPTVNNPNGSEELVNSGFESPHSESKIGNDVIINHKLSKAASVRANPSKDVPFGTNDHSWTTEKLESFASFVDGPTTDTADGFFSTEMMDEQGKKYLKVENGGFDYMNKMSDGAIRETYDATSCQQEPPFISTKLEKAPSSSPNNCLQSSIQLVGSDKIPSSSVAELDPVEDELESGEDGFNHYTPIGSSVGSVHSKSMKNSHESQCEKGRARSDDGLKSKNSLYSEMKYENHTEVLAASHGIFHGIGSSSSRQKGLSRSPPVNDTSFEASSFHQLQHAMDKLDVRTKLCIRDSLYRLAQSAERRHNYTDLNGHLENDGDSIVSFVPDEANSYLMNIERDTNPVDRSVAHLLFHRPSKSSPPVNLSGSGSCLISPTPESRKIHDSQDQT